MLAQSLLIIHDGSYMKEVSTHISLVATMVYCRIAKAQCKCTWAKQSASVGSYREEILGGVMMQLIPNAAASKCHDAITLVMVDCDNNGVVSHGNEPLRPFPTNQSGRYSSHFQKPHCHSAIPRTIQIRAFTCWWHKELARLFAVRN